jgi:hypothetical protein
VFFSSSLVSAVLRGGTAPVIVVGLLLRLTAPT